MLRIYWKMVPLLLLAVTMFAVAIFVYASVSTIYPAVYLSLAFPLNWILLQDKGLILAIFIFKSKPSVLICKF